ncbi:MAG TPA: hypothetical protein VME63_18325 [Dyella sp.]|uniref:hypothetical protein n=1 Tax=Dyella sp. TaxID=1869338 RepID=UPI002CFF6C63|nr:hypothetical protein [Dyella sp.]HTV87357.1 hypothetical protein [Dyella sp.]
MTFQTRQSQGRFAMPKMRSDRLGSKGELRFGEWCEDAGLICNKVQRDMAGWDFIVDFEQDAKSDEPLDGRKAPCSCLVQVKTINESTESVKVRLNMAERLAKDLKPSFIVVMEVREDKSFSCAYVLHIMDDYLEAILKRLRVEDEKKQRHKINKKFIHFKVSEAVRIEASSDALRASLERHAGKDMHAYANKKNEQMKTLGYGPRAHEGRFSVRMENAEQLAKLFLGEVEEVETDGIEMAETRFGIRIETVPPTKGKISIRPNPIEQCTLKFRCDGSDYPIAMSANAFMAPKPIGGKVYLMFKSELLKVPVTIADGNIDYAIYFLADEKRMTIQSLVDYATLRHALCNGQVSMEIVTSSHLRDMTLPFQKKDASEGELDYASAMLDISKDLQNLAKLSGLSSDVDFMIDDVHNSVQSLEHFSYLLETGGITHYSDESLPEGVIVSGVPIIVANKVEVGAVHFAYYGVASVSVMKEEGRTKIEIQNFSFKRAEVIGSSNDDFAAFRKKATDREGIEAQIISSVD